ncbi:class I SAM-dependent methyltransferase [Skermania sp. ID1734]|uniref:class I SAM-dependent methyltransferase n=1 Tax=Skermania sp. ID1734 TaxID=2597516 RepID=UPI00117F62C1|nr:class I SAM-dependent methyltransferase [Skermania sp. ID1734]TSE01114.1 class I SAM-dependent methyltransferase [Skermania sp. ID1734]
MKRSGRAIPALMAAGLVVNGVIKRRRVRALPRVAAGAPGVRPDDVRVVTVDGVVLDAETVEAARARLADASLAVLDLVPGDLPTGPALRLFGGLNPKTYRQQRLAAAQSPCQATLVVKDTHDRLGVSDTDCLSAAEMARFALDAKRCAAGSADAALAPGLRSVTFDAATERVMWESMGFKVPIVLAAPMLRHLLLAAGLAVNPVWGAVALAAYLGQPYLVFAGTQLRPRDLHRASATRLFNEPRNWLRALRGDERSRAVAAERADRVGQAREQYRREIAEGVERFLEPRRPDCPWCGSSALTDHVRSPDMNRGKPGMFVLDRCADCGHIFQNPRLTLAGLEFYYRDAYDGLGESTSEFTKALAGPAYTARAEFVGRHTTPGSWLDVGLGHGHFCTVAKGIWPEARIDGLDMSANVDEAARRGWIDTGYRGQFCELSEELAGRYDVVSMQHYLEHTLDPKAEIRAAAQVLTVGGYLLIEVPDPEWLLARPLGRYWLGWSQPEHLHMIPIENLKTALRQSGFAIVDEQRGRSHVPIELSTAAIYLTKNAAPNLSAWSPREPSRLRRIGLAATWLAGAPVIAAGAIGDALLMPVTRETDRGSAYRLLARLDG